MVPTIHYAFVARGLSSTKGRRWRHGETERAALYAVRDDALEGSEHGWWSNIADSFACRDDTRATCGRQLAEMPADYGLPLAACLLEKTSALLVTATDGPLAPCIAALTAALKAARSDGLVNARRPAPY